MKKHYITTLAMICYAFFWYGCTSPSPKSAPINSQASFPADLHFGAKGYRVIALLINKKDRTMSTLYGNEAALASARSGNQRFTPGAIMALVTWKQQQNPYWFGNNIPDQLLAIETVRADNRSHNYTYTISYGNAKTMVPSAGRQARIDYILSQKPSILP